jgi:hypothetical protein
MAPQSKGGQEFKKHKSPNAKKAGSWTPKNFFFVVLLVLKFKNDL